MEKITNWQMLIRDYFPDKRSFARFMTDLFLQGYDLASPEEDEEGGKTPTWEELELVFYAWLNTEKEVGVSDAESLGRIPVD